MEPMIEGKRVLDVGCGRGFLSRRLAQKGFELTCLDVSKKALVAIKNLEGKGMSQKMDLILGDAQWLPLRNELYDSVICTDVLEHLPKDEKALEEIYRVSKPQGISVIAVPTLKFLWSRFDKHMGHLRRYDKAEMERKLKRKGFNIESLRYWNTCSLPGIFIIRKILKKESSLSSLVKPSRLTNLILNAIINIEKVLRFPIGLSIIVRACVASKNTYHFKTKAR